MENGKMELFGDYIRKIREEKNEKDKNFSLRKVASRLDVEPSYLSKIERNLEKPSEEIVIKLSVEYSLNEDVLLAMVGKVSSKLVGIIMKNPELFSNLLKNLEDMPEDAILRVIREVRDGNW